jgi:Fe-Mn family superoxide dismutase
MKHELPLLLYDYGALEPYIDAMTMQVHYDKHHQGYVAKLNDALKDYSELQEKTVEDLLSDISAIPETIRQTVKNNGGGHLNHSFFWLALAPAGKGGEPSGKLAQALCSAFGNFEKFKEELSRLANNFFGSGWAWLATDRSGNLRTLALSNHETPLTQGLKPILVIDLWEHAYYLKYQNRRAEYVTAWWSVINWIQASKNFESLD